MKKLSLTNVVALALLLALPACTKKASVTPQVGHQETQGHPFIAMSGTTQHTDLVNGICTGPGTICTVIPTVVIHGTPTGPKGVDTSKLRYAELGGASAVKQVFGSSNYQPVCAQLSADQVKALLSGTYVIHITSHTPDHITFIAGNGSVSIGNFAFAVQLDVVE